MTTVQLTTGSGKTGVIQRTPRTSVLEQSQTVFIVDDDASVRDSLRLLVASVGHRVETFASAPDFLGGYEPGRAGCLVLDVCMPEMSGMELLDVLTATDVLLPVIFITGHGNVPMAVESIQRGAVSFLQKPFRDQALLDALSVALGHDARIRQALER